MTKSFRVALMALMAATAVLLGYIEHLIPVVPPIAGIKLGLSNIAVLLTLQITDSPRAALSVNLTRVLLCAALFAGMGTLPYSMAGGLTAWAVMCLLRHDTDFSAAGLSAAGGAAHMAAQVAVATAVTSTAQIGFLLPPLMAVGTLTGLLNGMLVNWIKHNCQPLWNRFSGIQ